ncbi:MAG: glycosyltransferase family 2 protein [Coprococcus sp.]
MFGSSDPCRSDRVKKTPTFRIGAVIMFIPRKIKSYLVETNRGKAMGTKVSVILPVYNVSDYLRQCMDSIVGQTLKDIEIICVDDGSTDDSLAILKEYEAKDQRVKVIQQANAGAGAARNKGLEIATGEYLSFLDSDDFFEPDMLEKAWSKAHETRAQVVVFRSDQYREDLQEFVQVRWTLHEKEPSTVQTNVFS